MSGSAVAYRRGHERGEALAALCRFQIARVPVLVAVIAGVGAGNGPAALVAAAVVIVACCAIAAALNDRADVESDRANGRLDRPLASGALGPGHVRAVVAGAAAVAAAAQVALPQPNGAAVTAAAAVVAWATACEPVALQRRGVVGLVALGGAYFVLPAALVLGPGAAVALAPLALVAAGVLAHKDVRDEYGDRAAGKATVLVRVGERTMAGIAVVLATLGAAGLIVTVGAGWWCLPVAVALGALGAMGRHGHRSGEWSLARVALIVTALGGVG